LALALAARLPVEIISVDSALVYRGMDVGTAKPSAAERAAAPHHLIDIRDPAQPYSAAEFARDAAGLIAAIQRRGRHPLLVGGTMLYFKALFDGLDDLPPADPAVRRQIDERAARLGWPALHAELARIDPATAARLPPGDAQRIPRALEVWRITGRPLSSFHTLRQAAGASGARDPGHSARSEAESRNPRQRSEDAPHGFRDCARNDNGCVARPRQSGSSVSAASGREEQNPFAPLAQEAGRATNNAHWTATTAFFSLEPADRAWLHQRIAARFDAMLDDGLLAEVAALRARGDLNPALPSMRCVGYRQAWQALDDAAPATTLTPAQIAALRERALAATRQLAKRQLTWLRAMPQRRVLTVGEGTALQSLTAQVLHALTSATSAR
jgi:tRNA dimethylallyltransferase